MIYSRFLHTEFEQAPNDDREGAYSIFSTQQSINYDLTHLKTTHIQTFAVLWDDSIDTRLINLIEKSIIQRALSPVKLLHVSKGTMMVVFDKNISLEIRQKLDEIWQDLSARALYDDWTAELISEAEVENATSGGPALRTYAQAILKHHDLGIKEFTLEHFLFADEWTPEAVFGHGVRNRPVRDQREVDDPDWFEDDIAF